MSLLRNHVFKKRKKTATEDWRKNKGQDYKEYIYQNRRLKKQKEIFLQHRITWKAKRNKEDFFAFIQGLAGVSPKEETIEDEEVIVSEHTEEETC